MMRRIAILAGKGLRHGLIAVGALAFSGSVLALANYALTQGSGTNFASLVISSVHYAAYVLCDATAGATPNWFVDCCGGQWGLMLFDPNSGNFTSYNAIQKQNGH